MPGGKPQGLAEARFRFVWLPEIAVGAAQIIMCVGLIGLESQRPSKANGGLVELFESGQARPSPLYVSGRPGARRTASSKQLAASSSLSDPSNTSPSRSRKSRHCGRSLTACSRISASSPWRFRLVRRSVNDPSAIAWSGSSRSASRKLASAASW